MKWLKPINKKGSYIVEAVIVIPIFIAAVIAVMSIVPVTASCENMVFAAADEMRLEAVKSAFRSNPAALPVAAGNRILKENPKTDSYVTVACPYLYRKEGIDDLFSLSFRATFSQNSPAGIFDSVVFESSITARAFTGTLHKKPPAAETPEEDRLVYIFPEWGMRYHGKQCTYVKAACQMVYLSQDTKRKFKPCKLCDAGSAQIGSPVFCFFNSGQVYHLSGCRTVERYYVEIKKNDAVSKGYTPCTKCGGV